MARQCFSSVKTVSCVHLAISKKAGQNFFYLIGTLKERRNKETNRLSEWHFRQNKSVIAQVNFILLGGTHYSSKPQSMSEIDFSSTSTLK